MSSLNNQTEFLLQLCYECLLNAEYAVQGYSEYENMAVALQYINQSYQCAKLVHAFYAQSFETKEIEHVEEFIHQFGILNHEFLNALQTNEGLQWSHIELENLEKIYQELKIFLC